MNILLTPTLMRFLAREGYTHYLSKNDQPERPFMLFTPIRARRNLKQLKKGFDMVITTLKLTRIINGLNNKPIVVSLDTKTLATYVDLLKESIDRKNEEQA